MRPRNKAFSSKLLLFIGIIVSFGVVAVLTRSRVDVFSSAVTITELKPKNDIAGRVDVAITARQDNQKVNKSGLPTREGDDNWVVIGGGGVTETRGGNKEQQDNKKGQIISPKTYSVSGSTRAQLLYTDIVVYGGGTGGVMAAYQAAVLGKKVVLIEPTDWLGGQFSAAGVGAMDSGLSDLDLYIGAMPRFLEIVKQIYLERGLPEDQIFANCHWDTRPPPYGHVCIDPYVVNVAFRRLLASPEVGGRVKIMFRTDIYNDRPLLKLGDRIVGINVKDVDQNKYTIYAKVVIDASEYGDLIPYSGAAFTFRWAPMFRGIQEARSWILLREGSDNVRIQDITYVADLRKKVNVIPASVRARYNAKIKDLYPSFYPSGELLSFLQNSIATGTLSDECITVYQGVYNYPWGFYFHARYRAVGDPYVPYTYLGYATCNVGGSTIRSKRVTKFEVNKFNDYKVDALFLLDRSIRQQEICKAKELTLKHVAYLEALPLPGGKPNDWFLARENKACVGAGCYILQEANCNNIPDDLEKYMYLIPYVRESLRPAGLININSDMPLFRWDQIVRFRENVANPASAMRYDSVSISAYAFDLHDDSDKVESVVPDHIRKAGPFQLPLGIFIPTNGEKGNPKVIKGFLVAEKNMAVDRYIQGSLRVHPYVMLNGQVAGAIAALAVEFDGDTSRVKAPMVQDLVTSPLVKGKISPFFYLDIDYSTYSYAYKYSELMSALGIFVGSGSHPYKRYWRPYSLITRAQMAAVLHRLGERLGIDIESINIRTYNNNFKDTTGRWFEKYVKELYEAGITNGCKEDMYCPNSNVTLNHEIAFFYRLLKNKPGALKKRVSCSSIELPRTVGSWIRPAYESLLEAGLLSADVQNGVCRVKYLVEKCGGNYASCAVPGQPVNRVDTGRLMWDIYLGLN